MNEKFISVKWELMAVMLVLTLLVTSIMSVLFLNVHKKSLINEVELRGAAITGNVANNIADYIMMKYELESAKLLKEAMRNDGVIYAMVLGADGTILAHNDMTQARKKFVQKDEEIGMTPGKNKIYKNAEGYKYIEFIAPAVAKHKAKTGEVRIAVSYDIINNALKETYFNIAAVTLLAVLLSVIGAFFISMEITKPVNILAEGVRIAGKGDLNHKINIKSRNELGLLANAFNIMTDDLKKAQMVELKKTAMEKELEIAGKLQDSLLPKVFPEIKGYDIAAFYRSARETGGDYYDVIPLGGGKFGFVMADVSGKGVPAALIMTMLRGIINIEARTTQDPVKTLINLNNGMLGSVEGNIFATIFYAVLDSAENTLEMVSAGHHETLFYRSSAAKVETYCPKGAAIGVLKGRDFENRIGKIKTAVNPGDRILLFTDGISEARSPEGKRLGIQKVMDSLQKYGTKTGREIVDGIIGEVEKFTMGEEQSDDIAVLLIAKAA